MNKLIIALIVIAIVAFVVIGAVLIWYFLIRKKNTTPCTPTSCPTGQFCAANGQCQNNGTCSSNSDCPGNGTCVNGTCFNQCPFGQTGVNGACVNVACQADSDCASLAGGGSMLCIETSGQANGYCTPSACNYNTDCAAIEACINNVCVPSNVFPCTQNSNCYLGQACVSGLCVQPQPCPIGQFYQNGICSYLEGSTTYGGATCPSGSTGASGVIYYNTAQGGNFTSNDQSFTGWICCPTSPPGQAGGCGYTICQTTANCGSQCPYCVEGQCTCMQGQLGATCTTNADCTSNICQGSSSWVGTKCLTVSGGCSPYVPGSCPSGQFCSTQTGLCSTTPLGANCWTATAADPAGYYCVNGTYQTSPGIYGERCLNNSDCSTNLGLVCNNSYCIPS